MSQPFSFKQFHIYDHHSTMKVGTDAVLLGCWAQPPVESTILDVGTGCGILALMMAQRTRSIIRAIDIDQSSINQARQNFDQSPWAGRLEVSHISFEDYAESHSRSTGYIISNPPFFINSLKSTDPRRELARHAVSGFQEKFITSLGRSLMPEGKAAIVLAYDGLEAFRTILKQHRFYINRICHVIPRRGRGVTRVLIEISKNGPDNLQNDVLELRDENNVYTNNYKQLTSDFYLWLNE